MFYLLEFCLYYFFLLELKNSGDKSEIRIIGFLIAVNALSPFDKMPWQSYGLVIDNATSIKILISE